MGRPVLLQRLILLVERYNKTMRRDTENNGGADNLGTVKMQLRKGVGLLTEIG